MDKHVRWSTLFLILLLAGCTTRLIDFTMISTKNIDFSRSANFQRGKTRVEGKDSASIIIIIPTGVPSMKEAIDRAIESVPGAVALVDGVVSSKVFYFPYLFGESTYLVEGTPLIDPALSSIELESNYIICRIDGMGGIKETKFVSEEKYLSVKSKYCSS